MDDPRFLLIEGFRWISFGIEMTHGLPAAPGTGLQGPNWVPLSMRAEASFSQHGAYFSEGVRSGRWTQIDVFVPSRLLKWIFCSSSLHAAHVSSTFFWHFGWHSLLATFIINTCRTERSPKMTRKMTMEISKVLRLLRRMQLIFSKTCESIAPVPQNDFDTLSNT